MYSEPHYLLYTSSFLSAWGDRVWDYALYLSLSLAFPSSLVVPSLFALTVTASTIVFSSRVGKLIDTHARFRVVAASTAAQNGFRVIYLCSNILFKYAASLEISSFSFLLRVQTMVAVALGLILLIHIKYKGDVVPWDSFVLTLVGLILVGSIADLASMATRIGINKDWVVVISESQTDANITELNASITRLICKVAAPVFFSAILDQVSVIAALIVVAVWNVISAVVEILLLWRMTITFPDINSMKESIAAEINEGDSQTTELSPDTFSGKVQRWLSDLALPYERYFAQTSLTASLAYVMLFMTVLAPGALIINYLTFLKMPTLEIAAFQAASALVGVFGTFIGSYIIEKFGLGITGLASVWLQMALISLVVLRLYILTEINLWALLIPIILSRAPLWIFDIIEVQILQETIPEADRGKVNSVEYGLTSLMTLISFAIGLIAGTPDKFPILALTSIGCVAAAATLFTIWFVKHGRNYKPSDVSLLPAAVISEDDSKLSEESSSESSSNNSLSSLSD